MAGKKRTQSRGPGSRAHNSLALKSVTKGWVSAALAQKKGSPRQSATLLVFAKEEQTQLKKQLKELGAAWQVDWVLKSGQSLLRLSGHQGPVWVIRPWKMDPTFETTDQQESIHTSEYTLMRDLVGAALVQTEEFQPQHLQVELFDCDEEMQMGALVGLEMASYRFRRAVSKASANLPSLAVRCDAKAVSKKTVERAARLGGAVNLARHLVNLPANQLNPSSYAQAVQELFAGSRTTKVEVWKKDRLEKEKMGLILGVGGAAEEPPCLVHIRYRPAKASKKKPLAFVGKGITFDSGGLDIKPSRGMRLMKKDMGGSAAVAALAHWVDQSGLNRPCDFYLALAENAVDKASFRPGDVLTARNGLKVEIHNTDAEGRLVMADALDVAVTQKGANEPEKVIDVATLTGAVKVGLGADVAGLFSTDKALVEGIEAAAFRRGDPLWRMPLYRRYAMALQSTVSDLANAVDGFGGAITAALFLERFTGSKPWAHLDIYAWKDSAQSAWAESGGSGQAVQALTEWLEQNA